MIDLMLIFFISGVCLVTEAFFSGSELAIISADTIKIKHLAKAGKLGAKLVEFITNKPSHLFGTTLLGTNLSVVISTTAVTLFMIQRYGEMGELYSVLIMSPLLLTCGEIIPKAIFQHNATRNSQLAIFPLMIFYIIAYPLIIFVSSFGTLVSSILGNNNSKQSNYYSREQLQTILTMDEGHASEIGKEERKMIDRILDFGELDVEEVMLPLIDVVALPDNSVIKDAVERISQHGYSRLPVYRERVDEVIGMVYGFDLLQSDNPEDQIQQYIRPATYVPEGMPVDELMHKMRREGISMAVAVDEYGGAVGIITMEDILEEIVGEIEDESDEPEQLYRKIGPNRYVFNARMEIDRINEIFNDILPEGDYETLGGLVLDIMHRIPKTGEQCKIGNINCFVTKAAERGIKEVRLDLPKSKNN